MIDIDFNMVPLPSGYTPSTCWEMYTGVWNYYYKTELESNSYVTNYVSTSSSPCIDPAAMPLGPIAWSGGRIFDTFTQYKHATSVSVNVGSFCRLYVPNPAGGQDIATFSRPDAVLVGYTRDGRTITARATQPVSSFISISAPQGTEFYKAEVYADQNSTPCTFNGTLFVSKIQIQTANPDLAALTPIVTQNGSTTGSDGLQIVSTGSVQVTIPVSGSDLSSISSQTAAVMLNLSTQSPQVQYFSLADLQSGKVRSVTFNVNLGAYDVGLQTISAIVAPGNTLNESNFSNNTAAVQVKVNANVGVPKLTISNTMLTQAVNNFTLPGSPAQVDLVKGKSTAAIFDVSVANGSTSDPTPVTISIDLGDGSAPVTYPTSLTVGQIVGSHSSQNNNSSTMTITFSNPPLLPKTAGGPFTVNFKASASGLKEAATTKSARVKQTAPLNIGYFKVTNVGEDVTESDFEKHISVANGLFLGMYPIAERGLNAPVGTSFTSSPFSIGQTSFDTVMQDLGALAYNGAILSPANQAGIGIVSDNYFVDHGFGAGVRGMAQTPIGGCQSPHGTNGAIVEVGFYDTTQHEVAHTFGLDHAFQAPPVEGYWVDSASPISHFIDLMNYTSEVPFSQTVPYRWISSQEYQCIFQQLLANPNDPQVILIAGFVNQNQELSLFPMRYLANGFASAFDAGASGAVQLLDSIGNILGQASFTPSFSLLADTGETVPTSLSFFAVQLPIFENAQTIQVVQGGKVISSFNPNSQLLIDAIKSIPDVGFAKNPAQLRNSLLNKASAFANILATGSNQAALNKLQNDIRKSILDWVLPSYQTSTALQLNRSDVLATVDIIATNLQHK